MCLQENRALHRLVGPRRSLVAPPCHRILREERVVREAAQRDIADFPETMCRVFDRGAFPTGPMVHQGLRPRRAAAGMNWIKPKPSLPSR